jgi:DNA invertase Pin-like site-specific DNA recombinase
MSGADLRVVQTINRERRELESERRQVAVGPGASSKLRDHHRDRLAIVYVRQSSPQQVLENRESRERQYALAEFAERLGWSKDRVLLIDEDQGLSGKSAENRSGFQRLMSEVTLNHVGIVLGLELSRLSRSSKDWHHLVEVCAVFNTLLGDQDGIYDANDSNDRLLLGMKGAMSEFELITLRNRLERGRANKAQRGELFPHVPIGYRKSPTGEVELEPDEQAQAVVRLILDKFQELGTAWGVFRHLIRHKIQLGFRRMRGANRGQLEWRRPQHCRILAILRHPMYAGAYVYGMHRAGRRNPTTGRREGGKWWLPLEEIRVLLRDRVPAYITWDQFLVNQERLRQNRSLHATKGVVRSGEALLSGVVACGRCGRRMRTAYSAKKKPRYMCEGGFHQGEDRTCCSLKAPPLDDVIGRQVMLALQPAALELSLRAADDIEQKREELHRHKRQSIERARHESGRVERQFHAVEPENRLVARTLEARWEEALRKERLVREEYDRFLLETPARLSDVDRAKIRTAAEDIAALWRAAETTLADRKEIVRCLVDRVSVHVEQNSEYADATIHWLGGFTSRHQIIRPVGSYRQLRDLDRLHERIKDLHGEGRSVPAIADQLNQEGFSPPRRRSAFSVGSLAPVLQRLGLVDEMNQDSFLERDEWWVRDLARALGIIPQKVYYWAKQGWVASRRTPKGHWVVWADREEIKRLCKLKTQSASWTARRVPELTIPKSRAVQSRG